MDSLVHGRVDELDCRPVHRAMLSVRAPPARICNAHARINARARPHMAGDALAGRPCRDAALLAAAAAH